MHSCPPDQLCDTCRTGRFDNLRGVAACRADTWIESLPAEVLAKPWPGYTEKVAAIARRWVANLTQDEKLLALLAAEFAAFAAKRWPNATSSRRT